MYIHNVYNAVYAYIYIYIYIYMCRVRRDSAPLASERVGRAPPPAEKGEVLLRGVGTLRYVLSSGKTLLVRCPSVQWQPDGLTIRTEKWFLGAGFLGAPPIHIYIYIYTHIYIYIYMYYTI